MPLRGRWRRTRKNLEPGAWSIEQTKAPIFGAFVHAPGSRVEALRLGSFRRQLLHESLERRIAPDRIESEEVCHPPDLQSLRLDAFEEREGGLRVSGGGVRERDPACAPRYARRRGRIIRGHLVRDSTCARRIAGEPRERGR